MRRASTRLTVLLPALAWGILSSPAADPPAARPPYPDIREMIREPFDRFEDGTVAAGQEALRHRMRGIIYQSSQGRLDQPRLTQFERLVMGEPDEVTAVNREIVAYCRQKTAEIEAAWRDPQRRHPAKEVCQYQTELVPFAVGEGELHTRDARLKTKPGETAWLLSAAPSKTYVAYQPQPHAQLPLALDTPIARIESERFPSENSWPVWIPAER